MMTSHISLFAGLMVGFSIAVPIGPMGLLCIQRTLASGMRVGVCTGLGAATVNVIYGALVIVGLSSMAPMMAGGGRVLSFAGGVFLLWCAARTLLRKRGLADQSSAPALSPIVGLSAPSWGEAAMLLLGMFMAAATWWVCLSGGVALLRSRLTPAMLVMVNPVAGAMLTFYGALALARSAGM